MVQTGGAGISTGKLDGMNFRNGQDNHNATIENAAGHALWSCRGKFWHVPKDFALPAKTKRKRAWELWICGMELENGKKIRPFRFIKPSFIPKKLRVKFKTE